MTEPALALPDGYQQLIEDLKRTVAAARWHPADRQHRAAHLVLAAR